MGYFKTDLIKDFVAKNKIEDPSFFQPTVDDLVDPYQIPDLGLIVSKIKEKIVLPREKTIILADSDVDGISSLAIMENYLKSKKVPVYSRLIPKSILDEEKFYRELLEKIKDFQAKVVIFFDISYLPDFFLESLKLNKIITIVCDHHEISKLPYVDYYLNPKLSEHKEIRDLSSSGIAFKLVEAILREERKFKKFFKKYIILSMFGTLSDMVPMIGENRKIVKIALNNILEEEKYRRFFPDEMNINYERILFSIISNVNSLAKMGYGEEAIKIFNKDVIDRKEFEYFLKKSIKKKKREENLLMKALERSEIEENERNIIYVLEEPSHTNLLGQIAYKIKNLKKKNAIIIARLKDDLYKASMRVLDDYNAFEVLNRLRDLLFNFGGHTGAAGFMIKRENLPLFKKRFLEEIEDCKLEENIFSQRYIYDITLAEITDDLVNDIRRLSPFGIGFPPPLFHTKEISVLKIRPLSPHSEHFKAIVKGDNKTFKSIGLYLSDFINEVYSPAQHFDIWYEIGFLPYNSDEVQLKIRKIEHSQDDFYFHFMKGEE